MQNFKLDNMATKKNMTPNKYARRDGELSQGETTVRKPFSGRLWGRGSLVTLGSWVLLSASLVAAKGPVHLDPAEAGEDFRRQGEYVGDVNANGDKITVGVQVIALGNGEFEAVGYHGGLPGAGWNGEEPERTKSELESGKVVFKGEYAKGVLSDAGIAILTSDNTQLAVLPKVERKSPTLGAQPPKNGQVLFDGSSADGWENGKIEQGLLVQGTSSKAKFQSFQLHIEFQTPFQPAERGQARGNSGVYMQGRYETQVLDSFGMAGKNNETGGIYEISDPKVNMCFPPLSWQTYDIDFTAAKYDAAGKLVDHPRMTVRLNGVLVQDNVELPHATRAAPLEAGSTPGPIYLQDHGNPIRFRNIWVVSVK